MAAFAIQHRTIRVNGPGREYIKIELYNKPTVNNVPSSNASLVSWSPLPCVAGGQLNYDGGEDAAACGDPRTANTIAFPYHDSPQGAGAVFYGLQLSAVLILKVSDPLRTGTLSLTASTTSSTTSSA